MKKKYIPIGLVLILLIGITIYYFYPRTTTGKVNTVGTIEVHQYDITPRSSGYISGLDVDLGSRITAGETLFTLSEPTTNTALDAAKASLAQGAANLADLQAGAREDQIKAYKPWSTPRPLHVTKRYVNLIAMTPYMPKMLCPPKYAIKNNKPMR